MSTYINENFDGVTPPALPSGWTGSNCTVTTSTTKSHSSPNSLKCVATGGYLYAWKPVTDATQGNTGQTIWFSPSATGGNYFFMYARCVNLPSGATPPDSFCFYGAITGGDTWGFQYIVGGSRNTELDVNLSVPISTSDFYGVTFEIIDAADGQYQLLAGYVQRASDGFWLQPGGTWADSGVRVAVITFAATRYNAGWASGTYAVFGGFMNAADVMYFDGASYADLALWTEGPRPASPPAASAEVELIPNATAVSDSGKSGHDVSKLNTSALTDSWVATARTGGWVRLDAGSGVSVTPTAIQFTPGLLDGSMGGVEQGMLGAYIEGANSTSGPWIQLGRLATNSYPEPRNLITQRLDPATAGLPVRYIRIRAEKDQASCSQFQVLCTNTGGVSWRPAPVSLSPAAGRFAAGATVTMTTQTSGASVYETTGTKSSPPADPTNASTLYTAPLAIPQNQPEETVIKAIAYHASGTNPYSRVTTGYYVSATKIVPDTGLTGDQYLGNGVTTANWPQDWRDSRGVLLDVNAGGIVYDPADGLYHLIGQVTNTGNSAVSIKRGWRHYTSANFVNWSYAGQLILNIWPLSLAVDTQAVAYQTRLHVLINPNPLDPNKRLVAWMHCGDNTAGKSAVAVAANWPTATGDSVFTWLAIRSPESDTEVVGDSNVFYDATVDDGTGHSRGKAYFLCTQATTVFKAWQLDPATDWTTFTGTEVFTTTHGTGEAPCLFGPVNGYYYLMHSAGVPYGGGASALAYLSATTLAGLSSATDAIIWSSTPSFPASPVVAFNAQCTCVFAVVGLTAPAFVLLADLMDTDESPVNLYNARPVMWPMSTVATRNAANAFPSAGTLVVDSPASWGPDALPALATEISWDTVSNSGYQAVSGSYSWNHTCNGTDRFLSVDVALLSAGQTVTGITYNGVALSLIGARSTVTSFGRIECWGLVGPVTGTHSIALTLSGSVASSGAAVSYTGVYQANPTEAFNSNQATNVGAADATVTVTTLVDSDWVHAAVATNDTSITAGQTARNNVTGAGGSGANEDAGPVTPAGAQVMTYTGIGALATWAIAGYGLRQTVASLSVVGWEATYPVRQSQRPMMLVY